MEKVVTVIRGHPRIDLITSIDGVSFDQAWNNRVEGALNNTPVHVISFEDFVTNKRASGRQKDLADIEAIEKK